MNFKSYHYHANNLGTSAFRKLMCLFSRVDCTKMRICEPRPFEEKFKIRGVRCEVAL